MHNDVGDGANEDIVMLPSWGMSTARGVLSVVIALVTILGPALFMASSPCLDCDGVCGAAASPTLVRVPTQLRVVALTSEPSVRVPSTPIALAELPPRPVSTTV